MEIDGELVKTLLNPPDIRAQENTSSLFFFDFYRLHLFLYLSFISFDCILFLKVFPVRPVWSAFSSCFNWAYLCKFSSLQIFIFLFIVESHFKLWLYIVVPSHLFLIHQNFVSVGSSSFLVCGRPR